MSFLSFNASHGYLEGIVRGYKAGILKESDYLNLMQCQSLEDVKIHLQHTDYHNLLDDEIGDLKIPTLEKKLREKLTSQFKYLLGQASGELATFLKYITYNYMIDNVILLISGTSHNRTVLQLHRFLHPMGEFQELEAIEIADSSSTLYNAVLTDTPLAPYFLGCISEHDFDEMHIEIMRNTLYKRYLEDFYNFSKKIGGDCFLIMKEILGLEADRRSFMITINSFGTNLSKDDRADLFPRCGKLYPYGLEMLAKADDVYQVKAVADNFPEYRKLFEDFPANRFELEDSFTAYEIGDKVPIKEKIDKAFHHLELISYLYKVDKVLTIGKTEFLKMDIFSKISVNFKEFPDFLTPISLSDRIKFTSDESYTIQNWKRQSSEVEKQDDCSYDEVYDVETKK
ncbi:V-ATPase subunit d [Intoshia linei]|uniref:V-ATPase subunit d n=1 Tax=Intoshia linei TaxID=1819745 RepID=A0A177AZN7_9BILA|nr:V-ATPase subunit d [Intoshia linei]